MAQLNQMQHSWRTRWSRAAKVGPLRHVDFVIANCLRRPSALGRWAALVVFLLAATGADFANATIVRFITTVGNIDVRLFHSATPLSVANFLNYSTTERFDNTFIHRSIPGFIVQGGGFRITTDLANAIDLPADPPVLNEYGLSNLRGTLAYAKVGPPTGQPPTPTTINSATREWFFNLADNSSNLNNQNGGFTVFGRVVGTTMSVVDAIAAKQRANFGGAFSTLPVNNLQKVVGQANAFPEDVVNVTRVITRPIPPGDYDFNGRVEAADYTVWKNTLGSTTNVAADGNGNGIVDSADFTFWLDTLGQIGGSGAIDVFPVPEPATGFLLSLAATWLLLSTRRRRR
jgi:cyclophilin family peptidyl-prolyl cis-trans isomerase